MLADESIEQQVLGGLLISDFALPAVLSQAHVKPEHFFLEKHRLIFSAILQASEDGALDPQLVASKMNGHRDYVMSLPGMTSAPGNVLHHAKRLVEIARWRSRREACLRGLEAADSQDDRLWQRSQEQAQDTSPGSRSYSPDQLANRFYDFLDSGGAECFPLPFQRLTSLSNGGLKRGTVCIIAGRTSYGKSVLLDQCLESGLHQGLKVHLYINEMTSTERTARFLSRLTGVPYGELVQGTPNDLGAVLRALTDLPEIGITECAGWSEQEISSHARANHFDLIGVDHLSLIDQSEERDVARISRCFNQLSKTADICVLAVCQLNREGKLRGSGMLDADADQILLVRREVDEYERPLPDGYLYFKKNRNGQLGGQRVHFNGQRMRFELPLLSEAP